MSEKIVHSRLTMKTLAIILFTLLAVFAYAEAPHTDTPKTGEGLGAFLLRNGYNVERYKAKFIELNKAKLGKDNSLLLGVTYTFPSKNDNAHEPLLGAKYQDVKLTSHTLEGATYYLVSGHGGPDPGAMGTYSGHELCEDEYAYDIMLRLARELLSRGAKVHIIIQDAHNGIRDDAFLAPDKNETCMGAEIPLQQSARLQQRAEAINRLWSKDKQSYSRAVFLHIDSRSEKKRIDIFLYHHAKSQKGERLANTMRKKFEQKYQQYQPNRGFNGTVSHRNLQVLNQTNPVAVFLELGNIQNSQDQQRFVKPDNRQAVAKWMAEGLEDDYVAEKKK